MKRLLMLLVPLIALTGCATYGDGYYRDRTVYRDGGYYYPAYEGDGDYYYGVDDGYDYDYPYGGGIGYGYGYSPFAGLDRYRCRSYYGCVPSWGGYYPYHYAPGWSFSVGNTWGWSNWGWYNGYRWNDRPYYRDHDHDHDRNARPDYPYYGNEDNYDRWPRPMPKPRPDNYPSTRAPASAIRPGTPVAPTRRPAVGGERVRDQGQPLPRDYRKPAVRPGTYPAPRAVGGERSLQPVRRAAMPVQPAPARSGGTRMRYPEPVRAQPRQPAGEPAPVIRQSQGARYSRPMPQARPAVPQARPAPVPRATPMAKPAPRQAPPAPQPAPRPQVRPTSQNSTSDDEP